MFGIVCVGSFVSSHPDVRAGIYLSWSQWWVCIYWYAAMHDTIRNWYLALLARCTPYT